jgi:hypothetical protein
MSESAHMPLNQPDLAIKHAPDWTTRVPTYADTLWHAVPADLTHDDSVVDAAGVADLTTPTMVPTGLPRHIGRKAVTR